MSTLIEDAADVRKRELVQKVAQAMANEYGHGQAWKCMAAAKVAVRVMANEASQPNECMLAFLKENGDRIQQGMIDRFQIAQQRIRELEALMVPGRFPSDVMTAAGLVYHGKRDKVLAERLRIGAQSMLAAAAPAPKEGEL